MIFYHAHNCCLFVCKINLLPSTLEAKQLLLVKLTVGYQSSFKSCSHIILLSNFLCFLFELNNLYHLIFLNRVWIFSKSKYLMFAKISAVCKNQLVLKGLILIKIMLFISSNSSQLYISLKQACESPSFCQISGF